MSESTPSGTPADETQHIPAWAAAEPEAQPGAETRAQPGADAPAVERPLDAATRVDEPVQRVEPMQAVPVPSEATPAVPAGSTARNRMTSTPKSPALRWAALVLAAA